MSRRLRLPPKRGPAFRSNRGTAHFKPTTGTNPSLPDGRLGNNDFEYRCFPVQHKEAEGENSQCQPEDLVHVVVNPREDLLNCRRATQRRPLSRLRWTFRSQPGIPDPPQRS